MPLSAMTRVSPSPYMRTPPPSGVYFTALDSSCSITKDSHFPSVNTVFPVAWKYREIFFKMNSRAYFRTDWRIRLSKSQSRNT